MPIRPRFINLQAIIDLLGTISTNTGAAASTLETAANITVVVAGTRVQGAAAAASRGVLIVARSSNVGSVYVGDVTVTNNSGNYRGIELLPGGFVELSGVTDVNEVYVNADTSGDLVGVTIL